MTHQTVRDVLKQQVKDLGIDVLVANEYDKTMSGVNTKVETYLFNDSNILREAAIYTRKLTRAERRAIKKQGGDY